MLVADKHDCVEQKIKSRSCLRKVGTRSCKLPAKFHYVTGSTASSSTTRCNGVIKNVSAEYPKLSHSFITTFLLSF
jgi:hypothetical protein